MFQKDENWVKVRGAIILWFISIVHVNLIFNLCTMVSSFKNNQYADKAVSKAIEERIDDLNEFGDIAKIYSDCNHDWEKLDKSSNGVHITVACDKCGTIQVVDITKSAVYINYKE